MELAALRVSRPVLSGGSNGTMRYIRIGPAMLLLFLTACGPPASSSVSSLHGSATAAEPYCTVAPRAGWIAGSMVVDKLNRTYLVYIPKHLVSGHHYPLVLEFHGANFNAYGWGHLIATPGLAERYHFIVAFPSGWDSASTWKKGLGLTSWSTYPGPHQPDVDYVRHLISTTSARFCIDPRRIFASGFSAGGGMVHRLACDLSDRIVAIAPIAGTQATSSWVDDCHPTHPVSIIAFHGTQDNYAGIPTWARHWAKRDGCERGPTRFFHYKNVTAIRYTQCRAGTTVELYSFAGMGHEYPRKGVTVIEAAPLIWAFYSSHPRS
jgi:polyhydroxybutyrate depolymerase